MKFLQTLFISFFIYSLSAQEYKQVLIAKTSKNKQLENVKSQLAKLNIDTFIKKRNSYYLVYSKKSTNIHSLEPILKKVKPYFPSAIIVTIRSKRKKEVPQEKEKEKSKEITIEKESIVNNEMPNLFVKFALGLNSISGKTDNLLASKLNNNNTSYSLEAGYYYDKNIFFSFGYLNSFTSDIALDSIYASANYSIEIEKELHLYFGGLFGLSILRLDNYADASNSTSTLLGGQIGLNYEVYKSIELFSAYQALSINHNVALTNSSIEFSFIHNAQIGVKYNF